MKFPRRKLVKIEKHGIVFSRRCVFGSSNMQNECSTRKIINMSCEIYSGTRDPEVLRKQIPCDENRATSTIPFPVSSTTPSSISALRTSTLLSTAPPTTVSSTRSTTTLALSCEQGVLRCARTCISKGFVSSNYCPNSLGRKSFCYGCTKWTDYQYLCSNEKFDWYDLKSYHYIYKRFSVPTEDCRRTNYNYYSYFDSENKYWIAIVVLLVEWKVTVKGDFFRKQTVTTVWCSFRFWVEWS